ncbi:pyrroloquinoline quinone biosynthesis protein PqqE [Intrasporangium chromatireducens Q5-1]|uniref:Pyrroloquinoline quinone biosynthesis protein PqqE n=1 Tax=Intrasporangium chromatireducens Q5-1 TaxID=584657 RepID=W9GFG0_9MICO|nr:TIGR04053 family radical SAM/SPASM domain-containing protein [Intrasporangium chromatireducens]EWT04810.1 pyrroloquinoline quinone biosynthesis protein PqqE [Intrasporangium chromatireducens Q5-1]
MRETAPPETDSTERAELAERRAVRRLRHDPGDRPMIVIWEVTRACALVCRHCRADAQHRRDPHELTTEQGTALLDDIAGFGAPYPIVVLTGGDPFERPDLAELVRHGHGLGLHMALSPSVTPRLTPAVLAELRAAGAGAVSLSLDGATAATHDTFRGVRGVFDQTLVAAQDVKAAGFRLQVNSTVTRGNVDELPELLRRVLDLDVSLWSVFFLVPTGRGQLLEALTAEQVEDVLHWLHDVSDLVALKTTEAPHYRRVAIERARAAASGAPTPVLGELYHRLTAATAPIRAERHTSRRRGRPPIEVNSGRGFAFIDHRGDVYPSGFLPQRCGNVLDGGFRDIYRTSPVLRSLRDPDQLTGKCRSCEFREVCGGSRSQAYAVNGDVLGSDPNCVYVPATA